MYNQIDKKLEGLGTLEETKRLADLESIEFDVKSTVLESGKVKNRIIVFPKSYKQQDFKLGSGFVVLLPGALNFAVLFANNLNRKR